MKRSSLFLAAFLAAAGVIHGRSIQELTSPKRQVRFEDGTLFEFNNSCVPAAINYMLSLLQPGRSLDEGGIRARLASEGAFDESLFDNDHHGITLGQMMPGLLALADEWDLAANGMSQFVNRRVGRLFPETKDSLEAESRQNFRAVVSNSDFSLLSVGSSLGAHMVLLKRIPSIGDVDLYDPLDGSHTIMSIDRAFEWQKNRVQPLQDPPNNMVVGLIDVLGSHD